MSQHDMTLDNAPGVVFRGDANNALKALASQSGGPSAPGATFPSQLWADTGTGRLRQRNAANSAWLDRGPLDATLRDAASEGTYAADTGAVNAFACSFVPAITARNETTPLRFKVANGNTGACTINDGVGTAPLVGPTHAALQGGETVANGIALIQWNNSIGGSGAYVLVFCTGAAGQVVNQQLIAFTTAGTAPAFTLTPVPAIPGYAAPQRFSVKFSAAALTGGTLNVSGRGPKNLKQYDSAGNKVSAIIASGQISDVEYDGTDWLVRDPLPPASSVDPWLMQPIGVPIPVFDHLAGVSIPSTTAAYRYIKLTASDSYNSGVLTSESVTGSAPLVLASATINLAGSPINGLSVSLINTERRSLRPGSSGTLENDQAQSHTHGPLLFWTTGSGALAGGGGIGYYQSITAGAPVDVGSGTPRVGSENRPKNIGATYYMRIK
jgi:hypothetical protein